MGSLRLSPSRGSPRSATSDVARPEQGGAESGDGAPFGSAYECAELRAAFAAEGAHALSACSGSRSTSASAAVKQRLRRRLVTTLIRLGSHPWLIHCPIVCAAGARLETAVWNSSGVCVRVRASGLIDFLVQCVRTCDAGRPGSSRSDPICLPRPGHALECRCSWAPGHQSSRRQTGRSQSRARRSILSRALQRKRRTGLGDDTDA